MFWKFGLALVVGLTVAEIEKGLKFVNERNRVIIEILVKFRKFLSIIEIWAKIDEIKFGNEI